MEMYTRPRPLQSSVDSDRLQARAQVLNNELSKLLKRSRENSLQHKEDLQVQFAASQEFISSNLDEIQTVLSKFTEMITDVRISDWRRESYQLLKLGRKSVDTLQSFCEDLEQPLKESCEKLEITTCQSVKTLNVTIDSFYSDNFQRLIHNAEQGIEEVTEEATQNIAVMCKRFIWLSYIFVGFISLMVALGFSSYLSAEWPWETHVKASWQRDVGHAAIRAWPKLSNVDQQAILNSLSEIH